jgi:hypothetical protein
MDLVLEKLQGVIASAISELSADQLSWHPTGKWCAAEVLEHLYLSYTGTTKGFQRVAETGKSLATTSSLAHHAKRLLVVGLGYFPPGRKAPPSARPRGISSQQVLAEILGKIAEMDSTIRLCEEEFGDREKLLDHPILGPLNTREWRKFHLVHGSHHAKQIRQLRTSAMSKKRAAKMNRASG